MTASFVQALFLISALASIGFAQHKATPIKTHAVSATADWSAALLNGIGVGRASYRSSIARPSRTHLESVARQQALDNLASALQELLRRSPIHDASAHGVAVLSQQLLTSFPPAMDSFIDGSFHARYSIPFGAIDRALQHTEFFAEKVYILELSGDYEPTFGAIMCHSGQTLSLSAGRIRHFRAYGDLPQYFDLEQAPKLIAQYDPEYRCLRLKGSKTVATFWQKEWRRSRVFIVHDP